MKNLSLFFALLAGSVIPFQSIINGQLGKALKHPMLGTFVSFGSGTIIVIVLLLFLRPNIPEMTEIKKIPWYLYIGGALGVFFVTASIILVPKIGISNMVAAVIVAQLTISIFLDHINFLNNLPQAIKIDAYRIGGVIFLILGLILIQHGSKLVEAVKTSAG